MVFKKETLIIILRRYKCSLTCTPPPVVTLKWRLVCKHKKKYKVGFHVTWQIPIPTHPFTFCCLSGSGSQGQHSKQRCLDLPLHSSFIQLFYRDTEAFPSQWRRCNLSHLEFPPSWTFPKCLNYKTYRHHLSPL